MQAYLLSPVCPHAYVCVFIVCVCICSTNVLKLDWGSRFSHNIIGIVQSGERRDRKRRFVIAIGVIELTGYYLLAMWFVARRWHAESSVFARTRRTRHKTCNSDKNVSYFIYGVIKYYDGRYSVESYI